MNKDQIKGRIKEAGGKLQKGVGRASDDPENEVDGANREVDGKVQSAWGDLKNKVGKAIDK